MTVQTTSLAAVLVVCSGLTISLAQPKMLSLQDAIAIGLDHSRVLQISASKVDAASSKASEVTTNLLPSLKLSASYQRLSDVPPFEVSLPIFPKPVEIAPTVLNNYNARVALQQPIFTGFKLESNIRAANYLARASEFDNINDKSDLALNITVAYWTMYQTLQARKFMDENVVRLKTAENDTKNLLNAGLATKNDLLKVQLQLNNAQLSQIDAANDVQIATMSLNNTVGLPLETELQLTSAPWPPAEPEGKPYRSGDQEQDDKTLTSKALSSRPDLQAMQSRIEASKANVSAVQGNWWPQLFLTGGYTYARPNQRYQPTLDEFKGTWDVGVQMQFDIWNWNATGHQTEQAKATLQQNQLSYEQMKDNVSLDVKRQWLGVKRSNDKVAVANVAIEQAEENQRTISDKYKQGLATSTDLLDADVALLQVKTNYSGALVELEVARARLKKAVGE